VVHAERYAYSRFCVSASCREFERRLSPTMRQQHTAGHKAFVDYSGKLVPITDPVRIRLEYPGGIVGKRISSPEPPRSGATKTTKRLFPLRHFWVVQHFGCAYVDRRNPTRIGHVARHCYRCRPCRRGYPKQLSCVSYPRWWKPLPRATPLVSSKASTSRTLLECG
jgi:hypothetical protein